MPWTEIRTQGLGKFHHMYHIKREKACGLEKPILFFLGACVGVVAVSRAPGQLLAEVPAGKYDLVLKPKARCPMGWDF